LLLTANVQMLMVMLLLARRPRSQIFTNNLTLRWSSLTPCSCCAVSVSAQVNTKFSKPYPGEKRFLYPSEMRSVEAPAPDWIWTRAKRYNRKRRPAAHINSNDSRTSTYVDTIVQLILAGKTRRNFSRLR
jgi:hypothetical protein